MQQINKPRPDIRFHRGGLIELFSSTSQRLDLGDTPFISFIIDSENNLYLKKDMEGVSPSSIQGNFIRYKSAEVTKKVLSLPDLPEGLPSAAFRIAEKEGNLFPIITRKVLI